MAGLNQVTLKSSVREIVSVIAFVINCISVMRHTRHCQLPARTSSVPPLP